MPQAVIIGGRGQCGHAIGQRLVAAGWTVTATTTGPCPDPADFPGIAWVTADRDHDDLARAVPDGTDVVVDTLAFTSPQAERLIALGSRIGSAIVLSTASVYTDERGRSLDESTDEDSFPAWPVPIPEDCPTLPPGDATYSTRKAAIEDILRHQAPWPVTILRPGAIYGPHSRHLREWYFIKRVLDRRRRVILPFNGESVFQPTATVNLAELVALAADRPASRTLNCGDLQPPSVARISAIVDDLMNWSTERYLVPGAEPAPTVGNHPWSVPRPVIADMTRAQAELGYQERSSYAEALAETLAWVLSASSGRDWRELLPGLAAYPGDLFDYEAEDAYLARAGSPAS